MASTVHTFCRYCPAACGVEVTVENNRVTKIAADKQNPHSWQDFSPAGHRADGSAGWTAVRTRLRRYAAAGQFRRGQTA